MKDRGCRYVDLIEDDSGTAVSGGRSFFFISHGWGRPFVELVDQIIEHFKPENQAVWRPKGASILKWEEIFVWLDIFAINQNEGVSQGDDLSQLKEVVEDCDQTLMVLDNEGSVLTRIWCLFEAWHTGKKGKDALKLLAYGVKWEQLERVFIDLDVAKAKATEIEDRDRILADIAADVGVQKMTHQLKDALVNSVVSSIPPDDDEHPWNVKLGYELYKAARICKLYGRLSEAEPLYRRALKGSEKVLGPNHPETLTSMNNLALLLQDQGKLSEAEPLYRSTLETKIKVLGPDHPETLTSMNNLASLLQAQGKLSEAEPLFRSTLETQIKVLGPDHPDTLNSMACLASLLQAQGKLSEAEPLLRSTLETQIKVLGPDHPDNLISVYSYADLLIKLDKKDEAMHWGQVCVEGKERVFGPDHNETKDAREILARAQKM